MLKDRPTFIDDDDENDTEDDNVETFFYHDENGYWERNTVFNEDGLPLDEEGNIIRNADSDYRFKDDFDYSPFEQGDEDDE